MREGQFSDTQSTPPPHAANRLNYPPDITKEKFFFFLKKKKLIIFPPGIRSRAAASSKPAASWNSNDSPAFHQLLFLLLYLFILSFFLSFFFFWYCKYHGFNIFFSFFLLFNISSSSSSYSVGVSFQPFVPCWAFVRVCRVWGRMKVDKFFYQPECTDRQRDRGPKRLLVIMLTIFPFALWPFLPFIFFALWDDNLPTRSARSLFLFFLFFFFAFISSSGDTGDKHLRNALECRPRDREMTHTQHCVINGRVTSSSLTRCHPSWNFSFFSLLLFINEFEEEERRNFSLVICFLVHLLNSVDNHIWDMERKKEREERGMQTQVGRWCEKNRWHAWPHAMHTNLPHRNR